MKLSKLVEYSSNNHIDHRNRIAMNSTDWKELVSILWLQQVEIYITTGSKDHWQHRKWMEAFSETQKKDHKLKNILIIIMGKLGLQKITGVIGLDY